MMEPSFGEWEKRFILGEMIKTSQVDVGMLVDFIRSFQVPPPDWYHMQLPPGRNMSQCVGAAEAMFGVPMHPLPMSIHQPPLKRKSIGDLGSSEQQLGPLPKRLAMSPVEQHHQQLPFPMQPPPLQQQPQPHHQVPSPQQQPHPLTFTGGMRNVNIQPRPLPNGQPHHHHQPLLAPAPPTTITAPSSTTTAPLASSGSVRKRGRPSKAGKEAQQAHTRPSGSNYVPVAPMPPTPEAPPSFPPPSPTQPTSSAAATAAIAPEYSPIAHLPPPPQPAAAATAVGGSYQIVPGPAAEPKQQQIPPRKGTRGQAVVSGVDRTRPRGLPETRVDNSSGSSEATTGGAGGGGRRQQQQQRRSSPSVSSLISSAPRDAAVAAATAAAAGTGGGSQHMPPPPTTGMVPDGGGGASYHQLHPQQQYHRIGPVSAATTATTTESRNDGGVIKGSNGNGAQATATAVSNPA